MAASLQAALFVLTVLVVSVTADLTCPYGRELSYCHSGCPTNCTTYNTPSAPCPETCIPGCFCPAGLVEFDDDICVDPSRCSLLDGLEAEIPAMDQCSQYGTCEECITSDPVCHWCPYVPDEISVKGSRCRDRALNPVCPEEINDPRSSVEVEEQDNKEFDDDVQIRPQKLKLKLRVGEPVQFPLQFRLSENYPLDVYFLLDVTGSFAADFRTTVVPLATDLIQAFNNISSRYAVGFGSFGDKRAFPYSLTSDNQSAYFANTLSGFRCINQRFFNNPEDCNPTISFRHTDSLRRVETEELTDILSNISIHLNLDSLEGGMDGLLQVLTCENIIGWRNNSLRMLLFMSNAHFHLAGDGKVGAAFRPNPGECHLEEGEEDGIEFYEYTKDTFYDYPSVYQVRNLIRGSQTNVVFAVPARVKSIYQMLQSELGLGSSVQVTELLSDSGNIISVIRSSYDDISQEVRLSPDREHPQLSFIFQSGANCTATNDSEGCIGVTPGDTVSLNVTVNLTSCMNNTVVLLQSSAFGQVALEIEALCQCSCTSEPVENHTVCNGVGTLECGLCQCNEGMSGEQCQCEGEDTPPCGPSEDNQCSGRGRGVCECGECQCFVQEELLRTMNISKRYFGDYCECDDLMSCGGVSEDGQLCSGRGTCNCSTNNCDCTERAPLSGRLFFGQKCECNPDLCYNDLYPSRLCVYTDVLEGTDDAQCGCGGCMCLEGAQAVDGTCQPLPDECVQNEECARCEKDLQSSDTDCDQLQEEGCVTNLYTNDTLPSSHIEECSFEDDDGCTHTFFLSSTVDTILVDDDRECPSDDGGLTPLAWIIPVSVIGGLLLLGFLILLIVLLVVWILDRLEYKRFKDNLEQANWNPQENPMYVSPQQEYSNVAYKKSRRRQ